MNVATNTLKQNESPEKLLGIYRGVVEDNNDPTKAGRCKIRVKSIDSPNLSSSATGGGKSTADLPWAQPAMTLIEGSVSNCGFFGVPLQGSWVFVFYDGGDPRYPIYFASAPSTPTEAPDATKGFRDPTGTYPKSELFGQPDWWSGSTGTYPHVITLKTHGGHEIEIDSTSGARRYRMYHPSGTVVTVDEQGNITVIGVNNETINISQNKNETIGGTNTQTITGTDTQTVTGAKTTTAQAGWTINVTGNCTITASGTLDLNGADIQLN